MASLRDDPHLAERQIIVDGEHPAAGPFTYVGAPVVVDGEPYPAPRPAPTHGQHTHEVLGELGYSAAEIDDLVAAGVAGVERLR